MPLCRTGGCRNRVHTPGMRCDECLRHPPAGPEGGYHGP